MIIGTLTTGPRRIPTRTRRILPRRGGSSSRRLSLVLPIREIGNSERRSQIGRKIRPRSARSRRRRFCPLAGAVLRFREGLEVEPRPRLRSLQPTFRWRAQHRAAHSCLLWLIVLRVQPSGHRMAIGYVLNSYILPTSEILRSISNRNKLLRNYRPRLDPIPPHRIPYPLFPLLRHFRQCTISSSSTILLRTPLRRAITQPTTTSPTLASYPSPRDIHTTSSSNPPNNRFSIA